jgi:hypothetical protein
LVRAPDRSIGSSVRYRGIAMTGLSLIGSIRRIKQIVV